MPRKTLPFDGSEFFETPESQLELLADALETGHPGHIAHVLGVIARARGMSSIAKEAGVSREALYKALRDAGDPRLSTVMGVAKALGVKLTVERTNDESPPAAAE